MKPIRQRRSGPKPLTREQALDLLKQTLPKRAHEIEELFDRLVEAGARP